MTGPFKSIGSGIHLQFSGNWPAQASPRLGQIQSRGRPNPMFSAAFRSQCGLRAGAVWSCLLRLPISFACLDPVYFPSLCPSLLNHRGLRSTSRTVYFSRTWLLTCLISYLMGSILSGQNEKVNNRTYWIIILFHTQSKPINSGLRTRELVWFTLPVKYMDL